MAKVGSQNRLLIPRDLTQLIHIEEGKIGIYWDKDEKTIYIDNVDETQETYCVAIKTLDNKNRIAISRTILDLIDADFSSKLVIALKNKRIYIFKA